jgi:hypothetical protein
MSRLGEGGDPRHGGHSSGSGEYLRPSDSGGYREGTGLGGRSPVGLATVRAFLEATAHVSAASASAAAANVRARADDETSAIRAIRESMLALAVSRVDSTPPDAEYSTETPTPNAREASGPSPGAPVARRTREAREANPERLDLDHRDLRECCFLEGEHRVRLLNYRQNRITRVSRLESVGRLVFLDLTGNALESLDGVDACPELRVLLVGENRLRSLGNALRALRRLDVFDAHDNAIDEIGDAAERFGPGARETVRVLNLSGNNLRDAGETRGLKNLQELDLRRNRIETLVFPLCGGGGGGGARSHDETRTPNPRNGGMPLSLKRCYLSGNPLASVASIAPLALLPNLERLALDGTPWRETAIDARAYREATVSAIPGLKVLDGVPVDAPLPDLANGEATIPAVPPERGVGSGNGSKASGGFFQESFLDASRFTRNLLPEAVHSVKGVARVGDSKRFETPSEVAFETSTRTLTVRGRVASEATLRDRPGASFAGRVTFAEGVFSAFAKAPGAASDQDSAATEHLVRLLRWARRASPRATALRFEDRGMGTLALVDALVRAGWGPGAEDDGGDRRGGTENATSEPKNVQDASRGSSFSPLENLRVAALGNAHASRPSAFFTSYAIHRLNTLQFVDDVAVTSAARARAEATFAGLENAVRESFSFSSAPQHAGKAPAADGVPAYVDGVVARASEIAEKLRALETCWDEIVRSYVAEGLRDAR